jgi:acetyl esterase/lipase
VNQDPAIRKALAALGRTLGPDVLRKCQALLAPEQDAIAARVQPAASDVAYGPHPRHRLDLYAPSGANGPAPVLVFLHGGGFVRGDKRSPDDPFNAHVGRWAACNGLLGVVSNYRLAPEATWPSGGEDVGMVVDWLKRQAIEHGGDPDRIVFMGTSAGAAHIGTYLQLRPGVREVRAAVLLSGLYGVTPMERADSQYFGADATRYTQQASLLSVANSAVPLMVACAGSIRRAQAEFVALLGGSPRTRMPAERASRLGHNHYTIAMHIGTRDVRLADEVLAFVRENAPGEHHD